MWVEVTADEAKAHPLYGIGGVLGGIVVLLALGMFGALQQIEAARQAPPIAQIVLLVCCAAAFWALVTKHRRARVIAIAAIVAAWPLALIADITGPTGIATAAPLGFAWCVAVALYLQLSRRVRVTFEHRVRR